MAIHTQSKVINKENTSLVPQWEGQQQKILQFGASALALHSSAKQCDLYLRLFRFLSTGNRSGGVQMHDCSKVFKIRDWGFLPSHCNCQEAEREQTDLFSTRTQKKSIFLYHANKLFLHILFSAGYFNNFRSMQTMKSCKNKKNSSSSITSQAISGLAGQIRTDMLLPIYHAKNSPEEE